MNQKFKNSDHLSKIFRNVQCIHFLIIFYVFFQFASPDPSYNLGKLETQIKEEFKATARLLSDVRRAIETQSEFA